MALGTQRIEEIEAVAADVLREIEYGSEKSFAVDLHLIAEKYGLKLTDVDFTEEDVSGAFVKEDGEIFVNKKDPIFRKKFTIAHELGHYFLHSDFTAEIVYRKNGEVDITEEERIIEQEANWFAASLLMPREAVKAAWRYFPDVLKIAEIFDISTVAATWRIKYLKEEGIIA